MLYTFFLDMEERKQLNSFYLVFNINFKEIEF